VAIAKSAQELLLLELFPQLHFS